MLLLNLLAMQVTDEVNWGVFDFVFAGLLLGGTGLLLVRASRSKDSVIPRAAAAAIGVVAIGLGQADDAPGLMLFGFLLVAGAAVLTVRTAPRGE